MRRVTSITPLSSPPEPLRYLVDAQLPPSLARWLGKQGFSATAVREVGLPESGDGSILNFAASGGWTVIRLNDGENLIEIRSAGR